MAPLRIAVIYGGISEQKAGMDHYLHQVLPEMQRLAPEHRYVLIDHRPQPTPFKSRFEQLILKLPVPPARVTRWNLLRIPKVLSQFDLVFSPGLYGPVFIPERVASVMVVHDLTRYLFPRFFAFNLMHRFWDRLAYPRMLRRYDHVLAVSQTTRRDLMTLFHLPEEKITVAYHGADPEFRPLNPKEVQDFLAHRYQITRPYILFLGTLEPRKNLPALIQAFSRVADGISHDLLLVGQKGWKWEPIFRAIEQSKHRDRIRWMGYVPDEDRVFFYNGASMLVYPSWYEGFGMPLLEAMQCGCPILTSQVSAMPEVVGSAAWLIDPADGEALGEAIRRVAQEPELAEQMRTAGLEQSRKFSWERSARITLEVFEKVLEKKGPFHF